MERSERFTRYGLSDRQKNRVPCGLYGCTSGRRYCIRLASCSRVKPFPILGDGGWWCSIDRRGWFSPESASPATLRTCHNAVPAALGRHGSQPAPAGCRRDLRGDGGVVDDSLPSQPGPPQRRIGAILRCFGFVSLFGWPSIGNFVGLEC